MRVIDHKAEKGLCCAHGCTRKIDRSKDRFCPKHRKRYQKETDPVRYTYNFIKNNAKRRGKPFEITLDQFAEWCKETDYINRKGTKKTSFTIDRIDASKGYTLDNIQILTNEQNGRKGMTTDLEGREIEPPPF